MGSGYVEALLDRLQHRVAHVGAGDACIGDIGPGDDLSTEGFDDEGEANDLSFPAGELQPVGTLAQVRTHDRDPAIMDAALANGRMLLQQHRVVAYDAVNPFGVDDRLIGGSPFAIEERGDPPIAIGWPLIDQPANDGQKLCILCLVIVSARL